MGVHGLVEPDDEIMLARHRGMGERERELGTGDWGLGTGDWGLGLARGVID